MKATSTQPLRREDVLARQVDGVLILLDPDGGSYYRLDGIGPRVWDLCDGSLPFDKLVDLLARQYDAPRDVIERDAADLIDALTEAGLLRG